MDPFRDSKPACLSSATVSSDLTTEFWTRFWLNAPAWVRSRIAMTSNVPGLSQGCTARRRPRDRVEERMRRGMKG